MKANSISRLIGTMIFSLSLAPAVLLGGQTRAGEPTSGPTATHEIRFIPAYTDAAGNYHVGYFSIGQAHDMAMRTDFSRFVEKPATPAAKKELPDRQYTEPSGPMYIYVMPNTTPYGGLQVRPKTID